MKKSKILHRKKLSALCICALLAASTLFGCTGTDGSSHPCLHSLSSVLTGVRLFVE